jgi:hypothetical protein
VEVHVRVSRRACHTSLCNRLRAGGEVRLTRWSVFLCPWKIHGTHLVHRRATMSLEVLGQFKIPVSSSGTELATMRLVSFKPPSDGTCFRVTFWLRSFRFVGWAGGSLGRDAPALVPGRDARRSGKRMQMSAEVTFKAFHFHLFLFISVTTYSTMLTVNNYLSNSIF